MSTISMQANKTCQAMLSTIQNYESVIEDIGMLMKSTYDVGGKFLMAGNGGSAAQVNHFVAELIGKYQFIRQPINAISLALDIPTLTALSNDYGYDGVFTRPFLALHDKNDMLFVFSTSGNSQNIIQLLINASTRKILTVAFLGCDGGEAKDLANISIIVDSDNTGRIQEVHLFLIHYLCARLENLIIKDELGMEEKEITDDRIDNLTANLKLGMHDMFERAKESRSDENDNID